MTLRAHKQDRFPRWPEGRDPALAALRAKLAETELRKARLMNELAVLDCELATLSHAATLLSRAPRQAPEVNLNNKQIFNLLGLGRGSLGEEVTEILRAAQRPLTAQEIGREMLDRRGLSLGTTALTRLCLLIVNNLRRRETRGQVQTIGFTQNNALLWIAAD